MEPGAITYADVAILAVLLISGLIALVRGFVKELLHILCWIAAAVITVKGFVFVQPIIAGFVAPEILADIAAAVGLFIVSLLILVAITTAIARKVRDSEVGTLDRALGFAFGLARGALLLALAYLVVTQFLPQDEDERPDWFRASFAMPLVAESARLLTTVAPEVFSRTQNTIKQASETAGEMMESGAAKAISDWPKPKTAGEPGYEDEIRDGLDQLIESKQKDGG